MVHHHTHYSPNQSHLSSEQEKEKEKEKKLASNSNPRYIFFKKKIEQFQPNADRFYASVIGG
jgi:hypothetical protein